MFKRDKIYVFLVVLFSVLVLWSSIVFATDGLPSFPDEVNACKYYFIATIGNGPEYWSYYLFGFNESIRIEKIAAGTSRFTCDGGSGGVVYRYDPSQADYGWREYTLSSNGFSIATSPEVTYACSELQEYIDDMNTSKDFFVSPPTAEIPETLGVLAPIYQMTPLEEVVREILEILPVILVILVGLIGLRKALKFLQTVLHCS